MDHDNLMDSDFTDLFLNQEPMESPSLYTAMMNESETAQERVEERIRQLQSVTVRARQRQPQRCERNYISSDHLVDRDIATGIVDEIDSTGTVDVNVDNGRRGRKRDGSHLVEEALALAWVVDSPPKKEKEKQKEDKGDGNFYDCNICLSIAKDPVLTCCGHLFCWPCFCKVDYIDSTAKECPFCKGEVSDCSVIPIYGDCGNEVDTETDSGLKVPPRPKARRVEFVRKTD